MKIKFNRKYKKILADTLTPVGIYLRLRDKFYNSILLESSDYHGNENAYSFICCCPLASFSFDGKDVTQEFSDTTIRVERDRPLIELLDAFMKKIECDANANGPGVNGVFGYTCYDMVREFESVALHAKSNAEKETPLVHYSFYRYVLALDHFKNELHLIEHCPENGTSTLDQIEGLIKQSGTAQYEFQTKGLEASALSDAGYLTMVKNGKEECKRGNLFQVVLSREFSRHFIGDEFNVYRALRSVNPSPYLFYFDMGNFKIFGSSPEAQVVVKNSEAQIHPIAGTFMRTGHDDTDAGIARQLKEDKKENAEHVMLVDLARNDLSRNCRSVKVDVFAEAQFYSHVIHLVSKVTGQIKENISSLKVFADTFPAGTLSGAPKVKAMQVIDDLEHDARGYYGGAIGYLGFDGAINQAIIIRSFLSKNNKLFYRAGAGVTITSDENKELQEVNNKLAALRSAITLAEAL